MKNLVFYSALIGVLLAPAMANPAHTQISALSDKQRIELFQKLLAEESSQCQTISKTFYQGSDNQGNAYWNAQCLGKKAYQVQVANNAKGSTKVLDCALIKTLGAPNCFKTMPGSR